MKFKRVISFACLIPMLLSIPLNLKTSAHNLTDFQDEIIVENKSLVGDEDIIEDEAIFENEAIAEGEAMVEDEAVVKDEAEVEDVTTDVSETIIENEEIVENETSAANKETAESEEGIFESQSEEIQRADLPYSKISDILLSSEKSNIAVIKDDGSYTTYTGDISGLRSALWYMYENGEKISYTLYIGTAITLAASTSNLVGVSPVTPTSSDIAFASLTKDIVSSLRITSSFDELLENDSTTASTEAFLFTASTYDWYFSTDVELINIRYNVRSLYAQANKLSLKGGSYATTSVNVYGGTASGTLDGDAEVNIYSAGAAGFSVYGGNNAGTLTGNAEVNIYSTGAAGFSVYGGNSTGTLTGDVETNIYSTGTGAFSIVGGNNTGTVDGNVKTTVHATGGNISSFYGAGYGASTSNKATVTGNVTTEIKSISGTLATFYGGGRYADVNGTISNTISGAGGNSANLVFFYGGSYAGNIGSNRSGDAIINNVDFSGYTRNAYYRSVVGANELSGTITGNITNTVTAGDAGIGGVHGVQGGGGYDTRNASVSTSAEQAESIATFKVYGNIYTTLTKGCFSSTTATSAGYARAAGYGGYIEGNTTIEVGTNGWAYGNAKPSDYTYIANTSGNFANTSAGRNGRGRGDATDWDIVGGGGYESQDRSIYIKGDTKLIHRATVARWTYGGSFGGYIEGNTTAEMYGGIVHTLEGAGYDAEVVKGNSKAIVYDGEVDWFLSGGGWNDTLIDGNTNVTIYGGVINSHVGGTYGYSSAHTVTGDAEINIYGGDFSGRAHYGTTNPSAPKNFSGGPSWLGTIQGNTTVNIDYTGNTTDKFQLPERSNLSGGVPYGTSTGVYVGTNSTVTSITVNIKAGDGSEDALAGASIYGDGAEITNMTAEASLCRAENITINIDAPGSAIGELYATNSKHDLYKNVEINVVAAKSIEKINGGSGRGTATLDNFTNTIVRNAPSVAGKQNKAVIDIGGEEHFDITIGSGGIQNFTSMIVDNVEFMSEGTVLNGSGVANAAANTRVTNHGNNYYEFGDVTLKNEAGFGVASNSYAAIGKLTIEGTASSITSPSGRGNMIITDFDGGSGRVKWVRNGGDGMYAHTGYWFGNGNYYRVFTFSPSANMGNAINITPANLTGANSADGKTYIGDNDVSTGYGLALPGSFIEYKVKKPKGLISHDVDGITNSDASLPIRAYGTVPKGIGATEGILAIPESLGILPTLTFTPTTSENGSSEIPEYWVEKIEVIASDEGIITPDNSSTIGESPDYKPVTWTSPDATLGYTIGGFFTNESQLSGNSILITEEEASEIADSDELVEMMKVKGRPFLTHNIDSADILSSIKAALDSDEYLRKHEVTYGAGSAANDDLIELKLNVIVVKNGTSISTDRSIGLYAEDAIMLIDEANSLEDQADLDTNYTKAIAILSDGTSSTAAITNGAFDTIKNADTDKTVQVDYSFTSSGENPQTVTKSVDVQIEMFVCKIEDIGYERLEDAVAAANTQEGTIVIQMLVDNYELKNPINIEKDIVITTASKTDLTLPYKGVNDIARISQKTDLSNEDTALITIPAGGKMTLEDIEIDGNGLEITSVHPMIKNDGGTLKIQSGTTIFNYHGNDSAIYNNGSLIMSGGVIRDNVSTSQASAGAIYQAGTMSVSGKIIIKNNKAGDITNNVYLPETSVQEPYAKYIRIEGELLPDSEIGVMTDTTPDDTDAGIKNTIIAVPDSGVSNMEKYFVHDQLERNADAYDIIRDKRVREVRNLVLQAPGDSSELQFNLPYSGNIGIYIFVLVGGILTVAAVIGLRYKKKKG